MTKQRIVKMDSDKVVLTAKPEVVWAEGLRSMVDNDQGVFENNPGFIAIAELASADGYFDEQTPENIGLRRQLDKARNRYNNKSEIGKRVEASVNYLCEEVAYPLNTAGHVHGFLANAAAAACLPPDELTPEQQRIWGVSTKSANLLINPEAIVEYLRTCAGLVFEVGYGIAKSGAEILGELFRSIGTSDTNAFAVVMAQVERGSLTLKSFRAVFSTLRREGASFMQVPAEAIEAVNKDKASRRGNGAESRSSL